MSSFHDAEIGRSIIDSRPTALRVVARQEKIVFWSKAAEPIMGHLRHGVIRQVIQVRGFAYPRRPVRRGAMPSPLSDRGPKTEPSESAAAQGKLTATA